MVRLAGPARAVHGVDEVYRPLAWPDPPPRQRPELPPNWPITEQRVVGSPPSPKGLAPRVRLSDEVGRVAAVGVSTCLDAEQCHDGVRRVIPVVRLLRRPRLGVCWQYMDNHALPPRLRRVLTGHDPDEGNDDEEG